MASWIMGRMPLHVLPAILLAVLCASAASAQSPFSRGQKFQIILSGTPDITKMPLPPTDAPVWDVDLLNTDASVIDTLKDGGKIVICYFSAGTVEDWREDAKHFPPADVGKVLPEWPNEKWIRTGSARIRDIMARRIAIAAEKGCNAIDPDNTDGYQNDNGLNLKNTDAIDYMRWLQTTASSHNLSIGLKNSLDILPALAPIMDFAVNEQCAQLGECGVYDTFLASGKPVFHIEYPNPLNTGQAGAVYCTGPGTNGMSTVLKEMVLGGLAIYCDRSQVDTPTTRNGNPPRPSSITLRPPTSRPGLPSSTRRSGSTTVPGVTSSTSWSNSSTLPGVPFSTSQASSTSLRPGTTTRSSSSMTSSSQRPTSTGGGGGCRSKHWDQCGGNDWRGCTVCESPYQCKAVSPPWYYQCL